MRKLSLIAFCALVYRGFNPVSHAAEWKLEDIPQGEVEKLLQARLAAAQVYEIMDPFDKLPTGRAHVSFYRSANTPYKIVQKRIESRYHRDTDRFIKIEVETEYESTYPYKFLKEDSTVYESEFEKPYKEVRRAKIFRDNDRWLRMESRGKRKGSRDLGFTPMSLADHLLPAAASSKFEMRSGDQFSAKAEDLNAPVPIQKGVRYQAHHGESLDVPWKYEKGFSISSNYEFNDPELRSFSHHNGRVTQFFEKNDFIFTDRWALKELKSELTPENFEGSMRADYFKLKSAKKIAYAKKHKEKYPNERFIFVPQSLSEGDYKKALASELIATGKMDFRTDNELVSTSFYRTELRSEGGIEYLQDTTHEVGLAHHKGTYYLSTEVTRSVYDSRFPHKLKSVSSTTSLRHPETQTIAEVRSTEIFKKDAKWIKKISRQGSNEEKSEEIDWGEDEEPRRRDEMAFRTWILSRDRKVGDELQAHFGSLPDTKAEMRVYKIAKVEGGVTPPFYKVDISFEDGETLKGDVTTDFDAAEIRSGTSSYKIVEFDNSKSLQDLASEQERVILSSQIVKDALVMEKGMKNGFANPIFHFDVTMPKGKKIPAGPDQIVKLVDKDKNLFQVKIGHGVNAQYGVEAIKTQAIDSEVPPKWLKNIHEKIEAWKKENKSEINDRKKAQIISDYVKEILTYEAGETLRPFKKACEDLKGDCSEFSIITAALLRRVGIAAHTTSGYVRPLSVDKGAHAQVEALLDGKWYSIEATSKEHFFASHDATGIFLKMENNDNSDDFTTPFESIKFTEIPPSGNPTSQDVEHD